MKTFFKVLVNGQSCSVSDEGFETTYETGKWTKSPAKGTPLFVFDSLEHAKDFVAGNNTCSASPAKWGQSHIFSCHVKNPRRAPRFIVSNLGYGLGDYWKQKFKKKNPRDSYDVSLTRTVKGSFVCDAVKILEQVS